MTSAFAQGTTAPRPPERARAIADVLLENILSGHYRNGDRLPSEADLCAHFGVSRPTLREALNRLGALGLVRSRRGAGGGAFITLPRLDELGAQLGVQVALATSSEPPDTLRDARTQLLIACMRLAASHGAALEDLRAEIDSQSDFTLSDAAFHASCQRLYLALAEASGNTALALVGQALVSASGAREVGQTYSTRVRARYLSFHVRLVNGLAAGRPEDCEAALIELAQYDHEHHNPPAPETPPEAERPPRMRDLRPPPVQRLPATEA